MVKSNLKLNLESLKERKEWKRHAVNQGENIYRILPPFGENSDGYAYRRWVIAWLSDPQTGRRRPYASPRSFGEDACPVYEYVSLLEKKKERVEAALKAKNASREDVKEALKPFTDILWNIKPKASYVYNACNKSGEVGLLELKKTAHDAMKKQMMQYVTDYGQDPTSLSSETDDSGIWFKIRREGEGTNTEYSVDKNQAKKKTSDGIVWVDDRDALPTNVVDNYDSLGYDLTTIYKRHSYDELRQVLMANLAALYAQYPEARVEGFELETKEEPKLVSAAPAKTAAPKKAISTRFDDVDEEDEDKTVTAAPRPKATQPVKSAKATQQDDEIFAFAESLLND